MPRVEIQEITDERIREAVGRLNWEKVADRLDGINRFAGEGNPKCSDMVHSLTVGVRIYQKTHCGRLAAAGLLHDGPETVSGDPRAPFKAGEQGSIEDRIWPILLEKLEVPLNIISEQESAEILKPVDLSAARAEASVCEIDDPRMEKPPHEYDEECERLTVLLLATPGWVRQILWAALMETFFRHWDMERNDEHADDASLGGPLADAITGKGSPEALVESDGKITVDDPPAEVIDTGDVAVKGAKVHPCVVCGPPYRKGPVGGVECENCEVKLREQGDAAFPKDHVADALEFGEGDFRLYENEIGRAGRFWKYLFRAIEEAYLPTDQQVEEQRFSGLQLGFPREVAAYVRFREEADYWMRLGDAYARKQE